MQPVVHIHCAPRSMCREAVNTYTLWPSELCVMKQLLYPTVPVQVCVQTCVLHNCCYDLYSTHTSTPPPPYILSHSHHSLSHTPLSHIALTVTRPSHLQTGSKFAKAYEAGIHKSQYWDPFFEDSMDLIAKLPTIAAMIYRRTYKGGDYIAPDPKLDWAANLSHMMGYDDPNALELMRLYQTIHSDHEGGNVSAHTTHLVGSALSDAYLSFAAGMCGLAGPLHGLANQEVLRWLQDVQAEVRPRGGGGGGQVGSGRFKKSELCGVLWGQVGAGRVKV